MTAQTIVTGRGARATTSLGAAVVAFTLSAAAQGEEEAKPKLNVGIGIRAGLTLDLDDETVGGPSLTLDDGLVDQFLIRPYFSGQLSEHFGFTANFEAGAPGNLGIEVLDAIAQIKIVDELQVWFGQHIPAMDRNNMNGPFYHNLWNFPITAQTPPFDRAARDRGVTLWGLVAGGAFKYHLSMVDLQPPAAGQTDANGNTLTAAGIENARFAARATIHLWEPENFYYTSGTYYGTKDVFAIGVVAQYQQGVDVVDGDGVPVDTDNDYTSFSADLLIEKNLGEGGTFTLEGGYWNLEDVGEGYIVNAGTSDQGVGVFGPAPGSSYMAALSWLSPTKLGAGQLQPGARLQIGDYGEEQSVTLDVSMGYIVDGFNNRWYLNYRHQEPVGDTPADDWVQFGAQYQM